MPDDRLLAILDRLSENTEPDEVATRLCALCAEATSMSGAAIMMMTGDFPQISIGTTDDISALIEELQYTLGEGPCVDAYEQRVPVLEPDLVAPAVARWAAFTPVAIDAGVRAVFGFPLQVGAVRIGALNLYRDQPGPLTAAQHADALVLANVASQAIISIQADAPPGSLSAELQVGTNFRFIVHQAAGMISVQLSTSVAEALVRLRAHAFATDRRIEDVARDVIDRELRFEDRDSNR